MLVELSSLAMLLAILFIVYTIGRIKGRSEGFHSGIRSAVYFIDFKENDGRIHSIMLRNGETLEISRNEDGTMRVNKPAIDKSKIKVKW